MRKAVVFLLIVCLAVPAAWAKSALDLMLEGRFSEAKAILDVTVASPRYQLMYFALTESESARACSLYQVIAIRYPNSDCDSVARVRLDQARDMGVMVVPINEWAEAPAGVKPLGMRRVAQAAPPPPVVAAPAPAAAKPAAADTVTRRPIVIAQAETTQVSQAKVAMEKPAEKSVDLTVSFPKVDKPDSSKPMAAQSAPKPQVVTPVPSKVIHPDTAVVKPETKKEVPPVAVPPKVVHQDSVVVVKPETKKEVPPVAVPPKVAHQDSVVIAKPETKKEVPPVAVPPKVAHRDSIVVAKPETKKEVPPVAVPPKVAHQDSIVVAKPETKKEVLPVAVPPKVAHQDSVVVAKPEAKKESTAEPAPAVKKPELPTPAVNTPKVATPTEVAKPAVKEPVVSAPKPVVPPPSLTTTKVAPAETLKAIEVEPPKAAGDTLAAKAGVKPTKPLLAPHDKPMASPGQWFIQVGAFANFDNAHRLATTLQKAGYPIKLVPRESGEKKLLQVRVGGYNKRDECVPVADELKSKYQVPTVIISE